MVQHSRVGNLSHETVVDSSENGHGKDSIAVTTKQALLSGIWTGHVQALETAIGRFKTERPWTNDCEVMFFEIPGDRQLHVNVTHRYATKAVAGWAGPGTVSSGFVYNRRFKDTQSSQVIRHIRDMVFAARI